jgi:hypothetical protein
VMGSAQQQDQALPFKDRVHNIDFDDMAPGPDYLQ